MENNSRTVPPLKTKPEEPENEKPVITLHESRDNPGMAEYEGELLTRGQAFEKLGDKYRILWVLQ